MVLYVLRHAEAVGAGDTLQDGWRYLTAKGRSSAEKVSLSIAESGPKPRLIISSPLVRAVQTAEIAAHNACCKNEVVVSGLLLPGAGISDLVVHLKSCKDAKRVMLVGHEPQLGSLVTTLLGCMDGSISLKKGACVILRVYPDTDKPACFLAYLVPGKKRSKSLKKAFPQKPPYK